MIKATQTIYPTTDVPDPTVQGSYTFTLQTFEDEVEEVTPDHEGECFDLSVSEPECFYTSVSESECFFIETGENDEDDEDEEIEDIDLGELGFTSVKCVQAHGYGEIVIIGTREADEVSSDILAKIIYTGNLSGGITQITSLYYTVPLSDYSIDIDDVDRLETYDPASTISPLCIVMTDNTAIWLDSVLFVETSRQTDADAGLDPFFDEDTYAYKGLHDAGPVVHKSWYGSVFWQTSDGGACALDQDCSEIVGYCDPAQTYYEVGAQNFFYAKTKLQSDATTSVSTVAAIFGSCENNHLPSICAFEGCRFVTTSYSLSRKREGMYIIEDGTGTGKLYVGEPPASDYHTARWTTKSYNESTMLYNYSVNVHGQTGGLLDEDEAMPISAFSPTSSVKINLGGQYFTFSSSGNMYYYSRDGANDGYLENSHNSTTVGIIAVVADGTRYLRQINLDEE